MSNCLTPKAKKINKQFADNYYSKFLSKRFGVTTCSTLQDFTVSIIRKQLLDWQLKGGAPCDEMCTAENSTC